ncbi:hypothetical protein EJMOOK_12870 [Rhodanobacter sp. Root179]
MDVTLIPDNSLITDSPEASRQRALSWRVW